MSNASIIRVIRVIIIINIIFLPYFSAALKSLQVRAKDRTASSCWLTALQTLIESCKSMDEILRSKFAVQLANCHLQASGLKTFPCKLILLLRISIYIYIYIKKISNCVFILYISLSFLPIGTSEMSVFECTEPLAANAIAFNTYTEFFIHSDHVKKRKQTYKKQRSGRESKKNKIK